MKVIFKCANCLKETTISVPGRSTLICQNCGCPDISFSHEIVVTNFAPGMGMNFSPVKIPPNEPFLGRTKHGSIWEVSLPPPPDKGPELKTRKK